MSDGRRLDWLVTAHFVLWLLAAILAPVTVHTPFGLQHMLIVPFCALTFSLVSLLGLWSIFSPSAWKRRLLGAVIGTLCLEAVFDNALEREALFMPSAAMALTVASLLVVRWFGVRPSRRADDVPSSRQEPMGFGFSIRGLMVLTAVVALLSAAARGLREQSAGHFSLVLSALWSVCFAAVSILTLWAASGLGRTLQRCLPAIAASAGLGAFFAYAADAHRDGWVYIITTMLLYPAAMLGSLLVVRSSGYHLVRRSVPRPSPFEFTHDDPGNSDPEVPTPRDAVGDRR
jgi:hypothetical protein